MDEADAPNDLDADARLVWLRLAPEATRALTLTPATAYQFIVLCRNIVIERLIASSPLRAGGADHRGMIQRIDAELARFCLAPMGRPMASALPPPPPDDPLSQFDDDEDDDDDVVN